MAASRNADAAGGAGAVPEAAAFLHHPQHQAREGVTRGLAAPPQAGMQQDEGLPATQHPARPVQPVHSSQGLGFPGMPSQRSSAASQRAPQGPTPLLHLLHNPSLSSLRDRENMRNLQLYQEHVAPHVAGFWQAVRKQVQDASLPNAQRLSSGITLQTLQPFTAALSKNLDVLPAFRLQGAPSRHARAAFSHFTPRPALATPRTGPSGVDTPEHTVPPSTCTSDPAGASVSARTSLHTAEGGSGLTLSSVASTPGGSGQVIAFSAVLHAAHQRASAHAPAQPQQVPAAQGYAQRLQPVQGGALHQASAPTASMPPPMYLLRPPATDAGFPTASAPWSRLQAAGPPPSSPMDPPPRKASSATHPSPSSQAGMPGQVRVFQDSTGKHVRDMAMDSGDIVRQEIVDVFVLRPPGSKPMTVRQVSIVQPRGGGDDILGAYFARRITYSFPASAAAHRRRVQSRRDAEVVRVKKFFLRKFLAEQAAALTSGLPAQGAVNWQTRAFRSSALSMTRANAKAQGRALEPATLFGDVAFDISSFHYHEGAYEVDAELQAAGLAQPSGGASAPTAPGPAGAGSQEGAEPKGRPARNLPPQAKRILNAWLQAHTSAPYPDEATKTELQGKAGVSRKQLNNWFTNARKRQLAGSRGVKRTRATDDMPPPTQPTRSGLKLRVRRNSAGALQLLPPHLLPVHPRKLPTRAKGGGTGTGTGGASGDSNTTTAPAAQQAGDRGGGAAPDSEPSAYGASFHSFSARGTSNSASASTSNGGGGSGSGGAAPGDASAGQGDSSGNGSSRSGSDSQPGRGVAAAAAAAGGEGGGPPSSSGSSSGVEGDVSGADTGPLAQPGSDGDDVSGGSSQWSTSQTPGGESG